MNFDFSAILDKIDIDAIMNKITDLIVKIDLQQVISKIVEFVTKLLPPSA